MRLARLAALLLVAVGLLSCKPAFEIRLLSDLEQVPSPRFVIAERDAPEARPRYHTVQVFDAAGERLVWHLRAAPFGDTASQADLRYGHTPDGFAAMVQAEALEPGHTYVLVVSGTAHGQLRFEVAPGGWVRAKE
jgi:hypothetical protein